MTETGIDLENIDPVLLFGVNNANYNILRSLYPQLQLVARNGMLRVSGEAGAVADFETKFEQLLAYYHKKGTINAEVIRSLYENEELASPYDQQESGIILHAHSGTIIRPRTANQQRMVELCQTHDLCFAVGPAGSGKTYMAIALAVQALKNKEVRKIILTRPAIEAGERLGFLPGDMKEKLDPYLQPLYDALNDMLPARKLQEYMAEGVIQIAPLAFMRGRTLANAFVILDEAQNTTMLQIKMFLTRMGLHSKFVVTGDMTQIDLPNKKDSGLARTMQMLANVKGVAISEFSKADIQRHPLVSRIVEAFDRAENN